MSNLSWYVILDASGAMIVQIYFGRSRDSPVPLPANMATTPSKRRKSQVEVNKIYAGDCIEEMAKLPPNMARLVIADPPYFQVMTEESWDTQWANMEEYLAWSMRWIAASMRLLVPGGLLYCFGQLGKREHVMLHLMSKASYRWEGVQFHDLIIWDRTVGYNDRRDSFTPCYEMTLVLRKKGGTPYFDKDAVREPYDETTIKKYLRDKRYKDMEAREKHLRKGKYATNIWRIPSLKGSSKEKVGHPTQKPLELIKRIILSSSNVGDLVVDPFLGSGTTAVVAQDLGRRWIGIELSREYADMARSRIQQAKNLLHLSVDVEESAKGQKSKEWKSRSE